MGRGMCCTRVGCMFRRVTTGEKRVCVSFLGDVGVCCSVLQKSVDVSLACLPLVYPPLLRCVAGKCVAVWCRQVSVTHSQVSLTSVRRRILNSAAVPHTCKFFFFFEISRAWQRFDKSSDLFLEYSPIRIGRFYKRKLIIDRVCTLRPTLIFKFPPPQPPPPETALF